MTKAVARSSLSYNAYRKKPGTARSTTTTPPANTRQPSAPPPRRRRTSNVEEKGTPIISSQLLSPMRRENPRPHHVRPQCPSRQSRQARLKPPPTLPCRRQPPSLRHPRRPPQPPSSCSGRHSRRRHPRRPQPMPPSQNAGCRPPRTTARPSRAASRSGRDDAEFVALCLRRRGGPPHRRAASEASGQPRLPRRARAGGKLHRRRPWAPRGHPEAPWAAARRRGRRRGGRRR